MSRSTTAVLLSALVLPGAGHLYLKHYPRGLALIAISLACLWVFVDRTLQLASSVLDRVVSAGGALDVGQLANLVTQTANGPGSLVVMAASLALAGCWVIGVVDAYRIARKQQSRNALPRSPARQSP